MPNRQIALISPTKISLFFLLLVAGGTTALSQLSEQRYQSEYQLEVARQVAALDAKEQLLKRLLPGDELVIYRDPLTNVKYCQKFVMYIRAGHKGMITFFGESVDAKSRFQLHFLGYEGEYIELGCPDGAIRS